MKPDATATDALNGVWAIVECLHGLLNDDDRAPISDLGAEEVVRAIDRLRQAALEQGLSDVEDGAFAGGNRARSDECAVGGGELRVVGELVFVVVHDDDFGVRHAAAALAFDEEGCALFALVEDRAVGVDVRVDEALGG